MHAGVGLKSAAARDVAAFELSGYVIGLLNANSIPECHVDLVKERVDNLRKAYDMPALFSRETA